MNADLVEAIAAASQREEVAAAVHEIYDRVTAEIDRRRPTCLVSGRCCRFEEYGHRLYVTTLELATFLHDLGPDRPPVKTLASGCPFQTGKLCTVHTIRPFGCRMFFCDSTSTEWQNAAYERFHAELKELHEKLNVPYAYIEWREALVGASLCVRPTAAD
jgi:Fe-S-cluster containining protein